MSLYRLYAEIVVDAGSLSDAQSIVYDVLLDTSHETIFTDGHPEPEEDDE